MMVSALKTQDAAQLRRAADAHPPLAAAEPADLGHRMQCDLGNEWL